MADQRIRLSGNNVGHQPDRRVRRTRAALIHAYNWLVLNGRKRRIGVADIVAEAKVGRSTFYEHFGSAEALHMQALAGPFSILADAAAGHGDETRLTNLLKHFWDNRRRARDTLTSRTGEKAANLLAELVEERLDGQALHLPKPLAAQQLAQAALAPVRGWLMAAAPSDAAALAGAIVRAGRALRDSLSLD